MKNGNDLTRIVWAVDAFGEMGLHRREVNAIRALTKGLRAEIEPVYVLTPRQANALPEFNPQWAETYRANVDSTLKALLKDTGLEGLLPHKILVDTRASLRKAVDALTEYAESRNADLLIASTHARNGVGRFVLGSFAETLMLVSKVPMLIVNPEMHEIEKVERILFPADFSSNSRRGFEAAARYAKEFDAELMIYYKPVAQAAVSFPQDPGFYAYYEKEMRAMKGAGKVWLKWAESKGVRASSTVDESRAPVAESIVRYAEGARASLIMMVAQAGPVASAILGSTTRQVVRNAACPVWVFRY